jgi:hypothetical protein
MLNIYDYHKDYKTLPLYNKLGHLMYRQLYDIEFDELDKDDLESLMPIISRSSGLATKYARDFLHGRFPEAEHTIMKVPYTAYGYARAILYNDSDWPYPRGRWPEAEPYIMKDPFTSFIYAKNILQHRWKEAEPDIMKDEDYWKPYKEHFGIE